MKDNGLSLPKKTPAWFKSWHSNGFWHFKYRVENRLDLHSKLLWGILFSIGALIVGIAIDLFFRT